MTETITPRIDVHMLTLEESDLWRRDCIRSLEGAPINLHILNGIEGHLGEARVAGYKEGNLPLVSFVDSDDLYDADVFTVLADIMDANPDVVMVYSGETQMDRNGNFLNTTAVVNYDRKEHIKKPRHVHGIIVMRREIVEQFYDEIVKIPNWADWVTTLLVAGQGKVLMCPEIGRSWRVYEDQSSKTEDAVAKEYVKQHIANSKN